MISNQILYKELLKEEGLTPESIPYSKFKDIVKMHNLEVMQQIIEENKVYNMGFLLGSIMAIEKRRVIRVSENGIHYTSINWTKSNERKKQMIAEGRLPREVYKDENGKITGDNGGENWLIYGTSETVPRFYWNLYRTLNKEGNTNYSLSKIRHYHLDFTIKNRRLLISYKENNDMSYTKDAI